LKVFAKGEHEGALKSQHSKDIYMFYIYVYISMVLVNKHEHKL